VERRKFIGMAGLTATASVLPALPTSTPAPYWCSCNRVRYEWRGEYYSATHIFLDGEWKRMDYGLFMRHKHIHRKMNETR